MSDHGGEWLLRIGIPSKGRLAELAAQLLADAGLSFRRTERSLFARCKDMPVEITFLRTDDIPVLVAEGAIGLGITGADLVAESGAEVVHRLDLGVGSCRLALCVNGDDFGELDVEGVVDVGHATAEADVGDADFLEGFGC